MATRKLDQSELMMRASESGNRAAQAAHEGAQGRRQQELSRAESARQFDANLSFQEEQNKLNRWQQQWSQIRANRAAEASKEGQDQPKRRTTNFPGGQEWRDLRDQRAAEARGQTSPQAAAPTGGAGTTKGGSTDLTAARAGMMRAPQVMGGNPGPSNPTDPAMQELYRRMERGDVQAKAAIEAGAAGRKWISDPDSPITQERVARARDLHETSVARRKELGVASQRAQLEFQAKRDKETRELLAKAQEKQEGPIRSFSNLVDRLDSTTTDLTLKKQVSVNDWNKVRALAEPLYKSGANPAVTASIDANKVTPELMKWLNEGQTQLVMQFVANGTGDLPNKDYIDLTTAGMIQFSKELEAWKQAVGFSMDAMDVRSRANYRRFMQRLAAESMLKGQIMSTEEPFQQDVGPGTGLEGPQQDPMRANPRQAPVEGEMQGAERAVPDAAFDLPESMRPRRAEPAPPGARGAVPEPDMGRPQYGAPGGQAPVTATGGRTRVRGQRRGTGQGKEISPEFLQALREQWQREADEEAARQEDRDRAPEEEEEMEPLGRRGNRMGVKMTVEDMERAYAKWQEEQKRKKRKK